jgi:hypothetical protein
LKEVTNYNEASIYRWKPLLNFATETLIIIMTNMAGDWIVV